MPKKSLEVLEKNKFKKGNLSSEEAKRLGSIGGKKSVEARREKKIIKDRILERMNEKDFDEMIDNLIARALNCDKSFEVLRDTIGQKPKEQIEADIKGDYKIEINVK